MDTKLVTTFLGNFASELGVLKRSELLSEEWLIDGAWNRQSWLHGRVWAALVRAVPRRYVPNIEISLPTPNSAQSSFKPDLLVCDAENTLKLMVDLESSNTSDHRVLDRHLDRLRALCDVEAEERPEIALILTIMPSSPIRNIPFYGKPTEEQRRRRQSNPYAYHKEDYLQGFEAFSRDKPPISLAWANLDLDGVYLEFWDGRAKKRPFWPSGVKG
jgi:hypothetical protein